jgi:hypothetical protein
MTMAERIYQRSLTLPDAAAQEALDFIEFLSQRYGSAQTLNTTDRDAASYELWFKAQIEQAIADERPSLPSDAVKAHFATRREALRPKASQQ